MLAALMNKVNGKGGAAARYLVVVLGGFAVDVSVTLLVHHMLQVDLVWAAAIGFIVAMCLSYFAHEYWTFQRPGSAYSTPRMLKFFAASGFTLATRLALVWLTAPLAALPFGALIRLGIAFGGSLVVGYVVNRMAVFGDGKVKAWDQPGE